MSATISLYSFEMPRADERTQKDSGGEDGPVGLVVCLGSTPFGVILEPNEPLEIGRNAAITIDHESVSRRHALIEWQRGIPVISDLESTNGTRVDGRALRPQERAPLVAGSALSIGRVPVLVQPLTAVRELVRDAPPKSEAPMGVVVRDAKMHELYATLRIVAPSDIPLLVLGETGCGKEVFASSVHRLSKRASGPFLALSCASLPESTLESELFGFERGAFTGATQAKPGLFEAANGGTLFLDEIGETTLSTQAKLLRVLESGEVLRLGSLRPKTVDVRIVSATNRDLDARVSEGHFRADLYFRIAGMVMNLPPLRERPLDVEALAAHFVGTTATKQGRTPPAIGRRALDALLAHSWPGNARELRNVMQRATILCGASDTIEPEHLGLAAPAARPSAIPPKAGAPLKDDMEGYERERIIAALEKASGNQTRAAEMLGIARRTLITKIEQYGIARPRKK